MTLESAPERRNNELKFFILMTSSKIDEKTEKSEYIQRNVGKERNVNLAREQRSCHIIY